MRANPAPLTRVLAALLALSSTGAAQLLRYEPAPESSSTVTLSSELRLHYERARTAIDGHEEDVVAQVPQARDSLLRSELRFIERVPLARDGRAERIERRYLSWKQEDELGPIVTLDRLRLSLIDRELHFQRTEDGWDRTLLPREESEQAPAATDPSRDDLQRLAVELDFRSLLPEQEVASGDRWSAPPRVINDLVSPGLELAAGPESGLVDGLALAESDSLTPAIRAWLSRLDSEGPALSCTYLGDERIESRSLAWIGFELEREDLFGADEATQAAAKEGIGAGQAEIQRLEHRVTTRMQGRVAWDLEAGRMARLEWSAGLRITRQLDLVLTADGESSELGATQVFRLELDAEAQVE